ncbi:MAG: RnfH family protein [Azoarcus sp.]|jgi:putative ubiquitin-RnfH superfamily antitoxin RatB of RatAB toxin-antitoxin module|nr:RnfH family protein [Azoarcus sp.]
MSEFIEIEVVYALPHQQDTVSLSLPEGATAREAVEASGLLLKYPDIDIGGRNKLGVYARPARSDTVLRDRDRVEIYRPLIADPKAVRKKRAEEGKTMKKGGGPAQEA